MEEVITARSKLEGGGGGELLAEWGKMRSTDLLRKRRKNKEKKKNTSGKKGVS